MCLDLYEEPITRFQAYVPEKKYNEFMLDLVLFFVIETTALEMNIKSATQS